MLVERTWKEGTVLTERLTSAGNARTARGIARLSLSLGLTVLLSSCQMMGFGTEIKESAFRPSENPVTVDSVSKNNRLAELAKSQHPRILATYGGEYSDPKLERMVAKVYKRSPSAGSAVLTAYSGYLGMKAYCMARHLLKKLEKASRMQAERTEGLRASAARRPSPARR